MGRFSHVLIALALSSAMPASAAETLQYGRAPAWVVPSAVPAPSATDQRPVEILLHDQQIRVEGGKTTIYTEVALKVRTADGLAAGNVSFPWQPSTDTITVNKLEIHRGKDVIDVLASGQKFTTLRREANLEAATLDGRLTANIQPEGLQVGDIIVAATTAEHHDPVMKGHVQFSFGGWNGVPIRAGRARVTWPADLDLDFRFAGGLPTARPRIQGKWKVLELKLDDIEPLIPPKGAPNRFLLGRIAEATNFSSWAEVGELMGPLFKAAAVVPQAGPLRDEVEKIRNASSDPLSRASQALSLVQDRVRYVALLMGEGSYVPASAEETWSRRFGDCKAKTALLMAILDELEIDAQPVAVQSVVGDALPERLPMVAMFDHVLVRARIGGKDYWLDGTRSGDGDLRQVELPNFGWGLPLVQDAELVQIVPPPLSQPNGETSISIDASAGVRAPAPTEAQVVLRGDAARMMSMMLAGASEAQRQQMLREYWKDRFDFVSVEKAEHAFEKGSAELRLSMTGKATLEWRGGYFHLPQSTVGYDPDFERATGPDREAPFSVAHPNYWAAVVTVRLPSGFLRTQTRDVPPIDERLAGYEYRRKVRINGDTMTIETSGRSLASEVSYSDAIAAEARLESLANANLSLRMPPAYRATEEDLSTALTAKPASAAGFIDRGVLLLDAGKFDEAIADFDQAVTMEPKNAWALANRGIAHAWKRDVATAEKDLRAAEALDADNPVVMRARGLMAELDGDFAVAAEAYSQSLQVQPGNIFALMHRAAVYRALNQNDKALADTEMAIKAGHATPQLRLMRANIFMASGDRQSAEREADLLSANSESEFALVAAGRVYAAVQRPEKAMQAFDRALAIKPLAYIYLNRAQTRPASEKSAILADLDLALELEPDHPDTLASKATLLARQGDYSEALKLFEKVIENTPDTLSYAAVQHAVVLQKAGRESQAKSAFAAIQERMKTPTDFNNLCWTKATAGILLESALEECRKALEMEPASGPYLDSLGMVLLKLGRLEEALKAYDKAVAMNVGSSSLMGRAFVHARLGDKPKAEADRTEALELDPNVEDEFDGYGLEF